MPKSNWDFVEEPRIENFYKIVTDNFEYALLSANRSKSTFLFRVSVWFLKRPLQLNYCYIIKSETELFKLLFKLNWKYNRYIANI